MFTSRLYAGDIIGEYTQCEFHSKMEAHVYKQTLCRRYYWRIHSHNLNCADKNHSETWGNAEDFPFECTVKLMIDYCHAVC